MFRSLFFSLFIILALYQNIIAVDDEGCQDDPTVNCTAYKDQCEDEHWKKLLDKSCPVTCNACPSTASPTTAAPCIDDPHTNCTVYKQLCSNSKYGPMLKEYCPVTCNMCPGATTVSPPTPNPRCYDSATECKAWQKNGYCDQCFWSCAEKTRYCAKTCGFCTPGACVDCNKSKSLIDFIKSFA